MTTPSDYRSPHACPEKHAEWTSDSGREHLVRGSNDEVGIRLNAGGMPTFRLRCRSCSYTIGHLSKRTVFHEWGFTPDTFDFYEQAPPSRDEMCSVDECDKPGVDRHHFAPKAPFGYREAQRWPQAWLCKEHHVQWHRTMSGYQWTRRGRDSIPQALVDAFVEDADLLVPLATETLTQYLARLADPDA